MADKGTLDTVKKIVKKMKFRHPFSWKAYKYHVMAVLMIFEKLDKMNELLRLKNDEYAIKYNEDRSAEIIECGNSIVQCVRLFENDTLCSGYRLIALDKLKEQILDSSYTYAQCLTDISCNNMSEAITDHLNYIKDTLFYQHDIDDDDEESDEDEDFEHEQVCQTIDFSNVDSGPIVSEVTPDVIEQMKRQRVLKSIELLKRANASRIIARSLVSTMRGYLAYDYIQIVRGADLIAIKRKENRHLEWVIRKYQVKFVEDVDLIKDDKE